MLNQLIIKTLPLVPKSLVYVFAKKYIAGPTLNDAVVVSKKLMDMGGMTTIDVLGEFVETKDRALHETNEIKKVLDAIKNNELESTLSLKPTSLGLGIDFDFAFENIKGVVDKARNMGIFVRIDMENSPYTSKTLDVYRALREDGYENVGIVLQAYLNRTKEDILSLVDYKPSVRLCKGIYVEDKSIAIKDKEGIQQNYNMLLDLMLDKGFYSCIATHDEPLIQYALKTLKERGLKREEYEFQMLPGFLFL